ncbi:MAG: hypothetical protein ABIC68_03150 [Candidatus Omnitrophota bacterium]
MNFFRAVIIAVCVLFTGLIICGRMNTAYAGDASPLVKVFFSPHCKSCIRAIHDVIEPLSRKYAGQVSWEYFDLSRQKNYSAFLDLEKKTGRNLGSPTVVIGQKVIVGLSDIADLLEKEIDDALQLRPLPFLLNSSTLSIFERFKSFGPLTIISAGFVDGFNPCAFTVVVFFMSFLTVMGYKRREMALIGIVYIFAVFTTYLLLGFGFFSALYQFRYFYLFSRIMYVLIGLLSFTLGYYALRDYFIYRKTGKTEGLALQLPKIIKKKIHSIVGRYYRKSSKVQTRALFGLVLSALVVGFLVSLLEAVCTGQMYLPVIIFVLKEGALRARAISYLFVYNLMFILPLIIVFVLALVGVSSRQFELWARKQLKLIKLAMAAVFFALGLVLLMGIY